MAGRSFIFLIFLVTVSYFTINFFPQPPSVPGFATKSTFDVPGFNGDETKIESKYDRLVIVLVDALRADFVFGENSGMEFTRSLMKRNLTASFLSKANSPTVTMPRIKALVSGIVPNFVDIILNFDSKEFSQDNWIHQLHSLGKRINFFGDDTWIKLFPNSFHRSEGTTSFYVSDTVEVDLNVTRHVKKEIESDDWDLLIFHYLGLDHIGHLGGPNHPLMRKKQEEMDAVIGMIYELLKRQGEKSSKPSLLLLCSDHGMNELGNHGGSSDGETSTVFVFMSPDSEKIPFQNPNFDHPKIVQQVDLAPTISLLFGSPIPKNSRGKLIIDVIGDTDPSYLLKCLQVNVYQQLNLLKELFPSKIEEHENLFGKFHEAYNIHKKYLESKINQDFLTSQKLYIQVLDEVSNQLGNDAVFNETTLISLVGFEFVITLFFIYYLFSRFISYSLEDIFGFIQFFLSPIILISSSFVEEEHFFWYFMSTTLIFLVLLKSLQRKKHFASLNLLLALICLRIARNWNQTGVKWADLPSFREFFLTPENEIISLILMYFVTFTLILFYGKFIFQRILPIISRVTLLLSFSLSCILVIFYKTLTISFTEEFIGRLNQEIDLITVARLCFISIFIYIALSIYTSRSKKFSFIQQIDQISTSLLFGYLLLSILLSRNHNVGLWLLIYIFSKLLHNSLLRLELSIWINIWIHITCGFSSYFLFGNSNSISTVDLSGAYTGLNDFNMTLVGILMYLITFGPALYFILATLSYFSQEMKLNKTKTILPNFKITLNRICDVLFCYHALKVSIFSLILFLMKNHLFIWTVFSPKYIYELFWLGLPLLSFILLKCISFFV